MSGWATIYDSLLAGIRTHSEAMARLQEQVTTGLRIVRASDGPADAFEVMSLQARSRSLDSYLGNLERVSLDLQQSSTVLQGLSDSMVETRQRLTQAASETYGQRDRVPIAEAIDSALEQALLLVNGQSVGRYLFGGDDTGEAPYAVQRTEGRITSVTYQGSYQALRIPIFGGLTRPSSLVGDEVFRCDDRQTPEFLGASGARAGSGTSSVRGDVWLTLVHQATTYGGTTGIAPGTGSALGDTVLGTGHQLTIDAEARTLRLDNGPAVAWDDASDPRNVRLENAQGDAVHVDVTGLDPGLSGTVTVGITATGKLSVDDLATTTDLTSFGQNIAVRDGATGAILYVDARAIARVGVEPVRVGGTYDLFGFLIATRDLLANTRNLSREQQSALIGRSIESLDEVMACLTEKMTATGAQLEAVDNLRTSLEGIKTNAETRTAGLQDADIVQVAAELARTQTFYEMMLQVSGRLLSVSLLDYI